MVAQPARGAVVSLMEHLRASPDLKARLLADLVESVSAGHLLHATAVAVLVGRNAYDLVQQALARGENAHGTVDERLQVHLRNVVTVLSVAARHLRDVRLAVHWYRSAAEAGHDAPETMVVAGRLEDVCRLLLRMPKASPGNAG